jgi:hypothetical protein
MWAFYQQCFEANVMITPSELHTKTVGITLSNIKTVNVTTTDDDNFIHFNQYDMFDHTATKLGLLTGATVTVKVKTENGDLLSYQVLSAIKDKRNEDGILLFTAKAIGDRDIGAQLFNAADVTVMIISVAWDKCEKYFGCVDGVQFDYNGSGVLTISDASDSETQDNTKLIASLRTLSSLLRERVLAVEITARRAGCNNVKTMIGFLDRICVDGKSIELRISKKGLKSKGCAAKKAVAGFKCSGAYEGVSIRPLQWGEWLPNNTSNPVYWALTRYGVLKKTDMPGLYTLRITPSAKDRVYSFDPHTKTVSSISANAYLEGLAQSNSGGADLATVSHIAAPGATIAGLMTELAPADGNNWFAYVRIAFAHAEMLGEETNVENIFWRWPAGPT